MLSSRCPLRTLPRERASARLARQGPGRGGKQPPHQPRQRQQAILGVARRCRECGEALRPLEAALHDCAAVLTWPFQADAISLPSDPTTAARCGAVRAVRIGARPLSAAAREHLGTLWEFVRQDLSHGLELPSAEALSAGSCAILLALRGRDVLGVLWAERIAGADLCFASSMCDGGAGAPAACSEVSLGRSAAREEPALGVVLLWSRRSERKRGTATRLVDAARSLCARAGAAPVSLDKLAFSQPTDSGLAFAKRYLGGAHGGDVLVYHPRG
mmetsp:Transcript_82395/g.215042  ORF Transcript_82395/g.215042 Transcript_82395/m.215042 type:complete len:273 (+) Transcript_82395:65-883(+)